MIEIPVKTRTLKFRETKEGYLNKIEKYGYQGITRRMRWGETLSLMIILSLIGSLILNGIAELFKFFGGLIK